MKLHQAVAIVLVLAAALALRLVVVAAIPNFFGSGDPSVYYAAARGCIRDGVPRIDFVWHFLTLPPRFSHLEDYCEPGFAYLLAVPTLLLGGGVVAAKMLSVIGGTVAAWLACRLARRAGGGVGALAAAIVAFEPWSIYYGGLIMKEATVSVVTLLVFIATRDLLASAHSTRAAAFRLGLLTVAAALVQYELLPILPTAAGAALWIHRRRLVGPYLAGTAAAALVLLAVTWWLIGVPISAKLYAFMGRQLWDPLPAAVRLDPAALALRFIPLQSALAGLLGWYPVLLALALLGARSPRVPATDATLLATFGLSYLYFHAVPGDVWPRDIIPATAVFAAYAALGIGSTDGWMTRAWSPAVTGALLGFALVAPRAYALAEWLLPGVPPHAGAAVITTGAIALPLIALLAVRARLPLARLRPVMPPLLVLALALNFHASLPWSTIAGNPQMPGYESVRAQRERVCRRIRDVIQGEPLMATAPGEVSLYTGAPSVVLPSTTEGILAIQARYRTPYLLVRSGVLGPGIVDRLPVDRVLAIEDYTLYRFVEN